MKFVKENIRNSTGIAQEVDPIQVLNISQARPMLSSIVADAPNQSYLVGRRGSPDIVIMDYKLAKKYVPEDLIYKRFSQNPQSKAGQKFVDYVKRVHKKGILTKSKASKMENRLAENVDKIVYGI